jgi:hypothetical protein
MTLEHSVRSIFYYAVRKAVFYPICDSIDDSITSLAHSIVISVIADPWRVPDSFYKSLHDSVTNEIK